MEDLSTFRDVIGLWPSRSDFASDLGVSLVRVHKWAAPAGKIRAEFFLAILSAAGRRSIPLQAEDLCRVAAADAGGAPVGATHALSP